MRYGNPSIPLALSKLREAGVSRVIAFPLYPQYSLAATKSSVDWLSRSAAKLGFDVPIKTLPAFYDDEAYLNAVAEVSAPYLAEKPYDMALFSFHGLPEHQVKKTDPTGEHCLKKADCCDRMNTANRDCYRAQCFATARALGERLGIPKERYRVSFQSRLGREPWIRPFTDDFYRTLAKQGFRRLAVICPSFVADCLETVEEVSLRGRDEFLQNGGEDLFLVPSVNAHESWVRAVVRDYPKSYLISRRIIAQRAPATITTSQAVRMGMAFQSKGNPSVNVRTTEMTDVSGRNQAAI